MKKTSLQMTVTFLIENEDSVWLGKKVEKIGAGCRNGPGGKPLPKDEGNLAVTSVRETWEEFRVKTKPEDHEKVAVFKMHNTESDGSAFVCELHVYLVRNHCDLPSGTKELLDPRLYPFDELPIAELMPADREWLERVLRGEKLTGHCYYGPFQKELIRPSRYKVVDFLPE